jgi:hypothetical protein
VAREPLGGCLLIALALAGCGGSEKPAAPAAAKPQTAGTQTAAKPAAALAADSVARVRFLACTDSVKTAMEKTAEGRKKLAVEPPSGMIRPEFLAACGKPPATAVAAASQASAAPSAVPAPSTAGLTPKQLQVLRADSIRKARDQAKADSLAARSTLARADSMKRAVGDSSRADSLRKAHENEVLRETFSYTGSARDPFQSLLASAKVGPEIGDLLLVGIYQDLRYASNSVAVLRDKSSGRRYKLRVGDQLGRLKVAQIRERDVVFTVEDFGYERQETLSLRKREVETQ